MVVVSETECKYKQCQKIVKNTYTMVMKIKENVSLRKYSTMRLGGDARYFAVAKTKDDLADLRLWAQQQQQPIIVIGDGSNILWRDEGFSGLVIRNEILGYKIEKAGEHWVHCTIGAGEDWDDIVERTVQEGYSGIEQLSLIPGTSGATPVQNVGAYGREIKDILVHLEAYDTQRHEFVTISNDECDFSYRSSRFKAKDKGRFLISAITLRLTSANPTPPFYESVQTYLDEHKITEPTVIDIRKAVIFVRTKKLPDPDVVANNGSFFANPIITHQQFAKLQKQNPTIVSWPADRDMVKISAAWLIEHAGFKDFHDKKTGMATWSKQPLVLVNEHAHKTADVLAFRDEIITNVKNLFDISLQQEPELI